MKISQHLIAKTEEEKVRAKNLFAFNMAMAKGVLKGQLLMLVPKVSMFDNSVALTRVDPRMQFFAHVETSNDSFVNIEELIAEQILKIVKLKKQGKIKMSTRIIICEQSGLEEYVNYADKKIQKALWKAEKNCIPVMWTRDIECCPWGYLRELWYTAYDMMF